MSSQFCPSSNPFDDDDSHIRSKNVREKDRLPNDEQLQKILQEIDDSEERQLQSTMRAIASIDESERIGIATAEELLLQKEQLNNIESKTGKINQDLKTTQKHITGIKSIFGGVKNWWNGNKDNEPPTKSTEQSTSKLKETIDQANASRPPAGERYKTGDGRGFYEDEDLDAKFMKGSRNPQVQEQYFKPVTNSDKEKRLNENLDIMSQGVSRLKGLAQGLGQELDEHNEQLHGITIGVDRADTRITSQNRQMRAILK